MGCAITVCSLSIHYAALRQLHEHNSEHFISALIGLMLIGLMCLQQIDQLDYSSPTVFSTIGNTNNMANDCQKVRKQRWSKTKIQKPIWVILKS